MTSCHRSVDFAAHDDMTKGAQAGVDLSTSRAYFDAMKHLLPQSVSRLTASVTLATCLAVGSGLFVNTVSAEAAQSDWFVTEGAKIRLISLPAPDGKTINAGLQIELEKGWKTYWRSPGATGLPPQLDFTGSNNIAETKVEYPVPMTFGENENLTAGYDSSVTLPITITPLFAGRPVSVKLNGMLGVCAEVCIPVQFQLALQENGQGLSSREVASELLFARSNLIGPQNSDFMVQSAHFSDEALTIEATIPAGSSSSTALVEGPSNWYLTPAHAQTINGTKATFQVSLRDIPTDAKPEDTELRITLVSGSRGVETQLTPTRQ